MLFLDFLLFIVFYLAFVVIRDDDDFVTYFLKCVAGLCSIMFLILCLMEAGLLNKV